MKQAIGRYTRDFVAIAVLAVVGLVTATVILTNQGAPFPSWLPGIGKDTFELEAEFSSAQAVTPGQGQTVNLAGVNVGSVSGVELEDGVAVVTMEIEREYMELIHPDASMLLRPRTGLQDMTIQLDAGTGEESVEEGARIPLANTKPPVNVDQILASLDSDTRDYLKLLLSGGATAFQDEASSRNLSAALRRFEPTARDLARLNGALAKRRRNIARVVHNFGMLLEEVGKGDEQLITFVDSSNAVMAEFADEEASLRAALAAAPGALSETRNALAASNRLSAELAPALDELTPWAAELEPALRTTRSLFETTTGPIRDQIRPFTRQVRRPVTTLGGLAAPLADSTRSLDAGLGNLNLLFNQLAYNPPGSADEGYLFWASWLNHNTNGLFSIQDAHGPTRRAVALLSCATAGFAEGVTASRPLLETLRQATRVPDSTEICPLDPDN